MEPRSRWESIYSSKGATEVSWYQREATTSLRLIRQVAQDRRAAILDAGGGTSTLVDSLIVIGYTNLTVLDFAANALEISRARLGEAAARVKWLVGDALATGLPDHSIDVWHDRALFHFLLDPEARRWYVAELRRVLKPSGHVVMATFAEDGPARCSGMPVVRYDAERLMDEFGPGFRLVEAVRDDHTTPGGARQPFRYCLCAYEPALVPA